MPIASVVDVFVTFAAPRRFWILVACGAGAFFATIWLLFLLALAPTFGLGTITPAPTSLALVLFVGGMLSCGTLVTYASIRQHPTWQVVLRTNVETRIVHVDPSRIKARIYASRIRRALGQSSSSPLW